MTFTQSKKEKKNNFLVILICFLIMAFQFAPSVSLVGLFISPIQQEFSVSKTAVSTITTIFLLASMTGSMVAGKMFTKYKMGKLMIPAFLISGLCYIGNTVSNSLGVMYLLALIRGLCGPLVSMIPISIMINNQFDASSKGKAIAMAVVGSGAGAMILTPITGYIIQSFGWKMGYIFFGCLSLSFIPILMIFFRSRSIENDILVGNRIATSNNTSDKYNKKSNEGNSVLKDSNFWVMAIFFALLAGAAQSWNVIGASYLNDIGFDAIKVSSLLSVAPLTLTLGKIILGISFDKIGYKNGTMMGLFGLLASNILLIATTIISPQLAIISIALFGFGMATPNVTLPLLTSDIFGDKNYSTTVSYVQVAASFGSSVFPLVMSMIQDITKSYTSVWAMATIMSTICILGLMIVYRNKKIIIC